MKKEIKFDERLMQQAISIAESNIDAGGGPFGAVIVKDGTVIATGANRVTANNDPTAHAEVSAIRQAAKILKSFDLAGCDIYSSCEPCPMCLSAIYWAHIDRIWYAADKHDAAAAGFDDSFIYEEIEKHPEARKIAAQQCMHTEAKAVFDKWNNKTDKIKY
jgi:tRNA(Arg) A34 adenosine deaminase TadA